MHAAASGQRMAEQSRHGVLERDVEQVGFLNVLVF